VKYYKGDLVVNEQRFGDVWTSRIDTISEHGHVWNGRIQIYGESQEEVEKLRDEFLNLRQQLEAANKLIAHMREEAIEASWRLNPERMGQ
jgi:hypothetical protein